MSSERLRPTTEDIYSRCPRLRILVVGKSGVGKSSLISFAFGVKLESISHQDRGVSDIKREIFPLENSRLVLHDSMGFEHGDVKNFESVKNFLQSRSETDVPLAERVHVIWLCVQVPHAGGRVFETGDEDLLKLASGMNVPVVVIFTQFDMLVSSIESKIDIADDASDEEIARLCVQKAESEFKRLCIEPLKKTFPNISHARSSGLSGGKRSIPDRKKLEHLIEETRKVLQRDEIEGDAWIVASIAQRASAEEKLTGCIEIGMKKYWSSLMSGAKLFGKYTLTSCLDTIHTEIVDSWNFYDEDSILLSPTFRTQIQGLAQLVAPDDKAAPSLLASLNLDNLETWTGLFAGTAAGVIAGPIAAGIGVIPWFKDLVSNGYNETPETLRCFMGYIINLTLMLNEVFLLTIDNRPPRPLAETDITNAFTKHKHNLFEVNRDIRRYVSGTGWREILKPTAAGAKIKDTILRYSRRA